MNFTEDMKVTLSNLQGYSPDPACFEWCSVQQVTHSNNLELQGMFMLAFVYTFITTYFWANEFPRLEKYKDGLIYAARLLLLMFFVWYFLHVRYRLI